MAKIPTVCVDPVAALIDEYHASQQEPPRPHLGASMLGHHCERWLWLSFRWAVIEKFQGRILRLFRRGHHEEYFVVSDLRAAGLHITDAGQDQSRVDFGAHVSGSIDGIIKQGVPESPNKPHILEIKTHSKKSFDAVLRDGVEKSKPMHYAQMQAYMLGKAIDRGLYVAVCKDDDRLYTERVRLDKTIAEKLIQKGRRIALSERMPEPCSADPSWYLCKFCPAHDFCFSSKQTQQVNCRTCAHATPLENSTWKCERFNSENIPIDFQRTGCESHVFHPDIVPWSLADESTETVAVWRVGDRFMRNGNPDDAAFTSNEILADISACVSADGFMHAMRKKFNARITK